MLTAQQEQNKYAQLWGMPQYREWSPGMDNVQRFLDIVKPAAGASILDIGCGSGKAGLEFANLGFDVWWHDITEAGLDPHVPRERFLQSTLWRWEVPSSDDNFDYGFCCDVMEHIPPEFTMLVLHLILSACKTTWFQIALIPDNCGQLIGETLHLTVRPFTWWRDRFLDLGAQIIEARDLIDSGLYIVRKPQ